jgi:hypothetical protein
MGFLVLCLHGQHFERDHLVARAAFKLAFKRITSKGHCVSIAEGLSLPPELSAPAFGNLDCVAAAHRDLSLVVGRIKGRPRAGRRMSSPDTPRCSDQLTDAISKEKARSLPPTAVASTL